MVRKDPLNERGPAPPGGRPKPPLVVDKRIRVPQTLFQVRTVEEYEKLWHWALIGCSSIIGLLEGYSEIGMPGVPIEGLKHFVNRLQAIIERHDTNVSDSTS